MSNYRYKVYGLQITSPFEIPELKDGESSKKDENPEVEIRVKSLDSEPPQGHHRGCYEASEDEARLYYKEVGHLVIRNGNEILVDPLRDVQNRLFHHILLGVAMGIVLHQKGRLTLHASAVKIGSRAAGFVGWKEMGKSTTVAAFSSRGYPLITDDILAFDANVLKLVHPGFPQVRLNPDSVRKAFNKSPDTLPVLMEGYEKRIGQVCKSFDLNPVTLSHLFVLEWGDELQVQPLQGRDAFMQLVSHSYAPRFLGQTALGARYFRQLDCIAKNTQVLRLTRPRDFGILPDVLDQVEASCARV